MDFAEKMQRCHEYVEALEEERRKIQVFQRELPLCLELVTQAIEACKRELSPSTTEYMHGQSECSEQTSSDGPVLEEFIPIKRANSTDSDDNGVDDGDGDDEHEEDNSHKRSKSREKNGGDQKKKSEWLRYVQLWNPSSDPSVKQDLPRKAVVTEVKSNGGAFQPFHKEKSNGTSSSCNTNNNPVVVKALASVPAAAASSTAGAVTTGANGGSGGSRKEEKDGQSQRKQRRCWSPELHRRFLNALQQLGGSHAATPKQIRELMKVDGLTNDEVKSHLQKYRLHTRRPTPALHNNSNPQPPQFVVVGGIWVPPAEYTAVTTTASGETATIAATNGIYAPVAVTPPAAAVSKVQRPRRTQSDNMPSEGRGSHYEEGGVHSNSPSTSSSTHNTTTSPAAL